MLNLELAEVKDKYIYLSAKFAYMIEVLGGFIAGKSFIDRTSTAPDEEVNCLCLFFIFFYS